MEIATKNAPNRLRLYRLKEGISINKLARSCRLDPSALSKVERGLLPAFPGWRVRLSEALGIEEKRLFPYG